MQPTLKTPKGEVILIVACN